MKSDIWIPMYIGDYLSDTIGLTLAQHGAYVLVIFAYWKNSGPLDDAVARSVIRDASPTDCERIASFFRVEDGKWHHKRIDEELAKANKNRESRSNAASTASKARWGAKHSGCVTDASRITNGQLTHTPSPSPSPSQSESTPKPPKAWSPDAIQLRINAMFGRRDTTEWSDKEIRTYRKINFDLDDLKLVEKWHADSKVPGVNSYCRKDPLTLLNNWNSEVDRARQHYAKTSTEAPAKPICIGDQAYNAKGRSDW